MTKFPNWFSIYSKPVPPVEPQKNIIHYKTLASLETDTYNTHEDCVFPEGCTGISCERIEYYDGEYRIIINFEQKLEDLNPKYKKEYAKYKKDLAKYEEKMKEWEKWKAIHEEEVRQSDLIAKKKLFLKLKKEFDSD